MNVRLRNVTHDDSARLLEWRNSPGVAAFMYADHRVSQAEHDRWFAAAMTAEDRRYWIVEMDQAPVGLVNLSRIDPIYRRCDWTYYLGDPAARGQDPGSQIEYIVLRHVFETMNFNKLWCEVLLENEDVWKRHESFGFVREAHYREHVCKGGRFQDVVGLGMLKADWLAARPKVEAKLREEGIDPASLPDAAQEPA